MKKIMMMVLVFAFGIAAAQGNAVATQTSAGLSSTALPILGGRLVQAMIDEKEAGSTCTVDHRTPMQGGVYGAFIEVKVISVWQQVIATIRIPEYPLPGEEVTRVACTFDGRTATVTIFQAGGQEPFSVSAAR